MKVLFIHNHYRTSAPSGEDAVARNERAMLEENGMAVTSFEKFNDDIDDSSLVKKFRLGLNYAWSQRTYDELKLLLKKVKPDIAHIHSVYPQISPSAYDACQESGVPVVHTLHNFRYFCPGALLLRDGKPCEECLGRLPLNALRYRCYRGSFPATASLVWMICYNNWRGAFAKLVNRYVALTEFAASRLIAGGLPADRIEVKPNFLPVVPSVNQKREKYAVYVGRFTQEKGVSTLIAAWSYVSGLPLKIIGDGVLRDELEQQTRMAGIEVVFMGALPQKEVLEIVSSAYLQVVPSECYEGFPMVILEAYACATPVVASRIGSLAEVVIDGYTGLHFEPGNPRELADKVNLLVANPEFATRMGARAREIFLKKYTREQNFKSLMGIYQRARDDFEMRRNR